MKVIMQRNQYSKNKKKQSILKMRQETAKRSFEHRKASGGAKHLNLKTKTCNSVKILYFLQIRVSYL